MGLDMYLYAEKYTSGYDFYPEERQQEYHNVLASVGVGVVDVGTEFPTATVRLGVGKWRKENAIHNWFVQNVQDGEDNCQSYSVSPDKLVELRDLCEAVLADNSLANELLPTQSGFFFGGTEFDEWYFDGLGHTVDLINTVLSRFPSSDSWDYIYSSSW